MTMKVTNQKLCIDFASVPGQACIPQDQWDRIWEALHLVGELSNMLEAPTQEKTRGPWNVNSTMLWSLLVSPRRNREGRKRMKDDNEFIKEYIKRCVNDETFRNRIKRVNDALDGVGSAAEDFTIPENATNGVSTHLLLPQTVPDPLRDGIGEVRRTVALLLMAEALSYEELHAQAAKELGKRNTSVFKQRVYSALYNMRHAGEVIETKHCSVIRYELTRKP